MDVLGIQAKLKFFAESWELIVGLGGGAYTAYRYVIKPRIVRPVQNWIGTLTSAATIVNRELKSNGGFSMFDRLNQTRDLCLVNADHINDIRDHVEKPLWQADMDGRGTRFNRAFEMTFGYAHAELLGDGWLAHMADHDRDRVAELFQSARRDRRMFTAVAAYITSQGVPVRVQVKGLPTLDGGRVVGWRGSVEVTQA